MKMTRFMPFFAVFADDGATTETFTKSIYLETIDNTRPVRAALIASGTWGSATLTVKFVDSADDSTFADVTDGDFVAVTADTAAAGQIITFTLGSNVHIGTGIANYGKFLKCSWITAGGTAGDIDFKVLLDNVFVPDDVVTMKLNHDVG